MKSLIALYHFLGSVWFAIILIAVTAIFVIAGTFIESRTESHLYAAYFTYGNPFFALLLWGFFLNILISALRRWPFMPKHVPFLITHLGLLMILAGALTKHYFGLQGNMGVLEGGGSQEIFTPGSYALHLEKREPQPPNQKTQHNYPMDNHHISLDKSFDDLSISLLNQTSHSEEQWQTWLKDEYGVIMGNPPFPLNTSTQVKIDETTWECLAQRTPYIALTALEAYVEGLDIIIKDTITEDVSWRGPLKQALEQSIVLKNGTATCQLHFNFSPLTGFQNPLLDISLDLLPYQANVTIPLLGQQSLLNLSSNAYLGKPPLSIDLQRIHPKLVLLQDGFGDISLLAFNSQGQVHGQTLQQGNVHSIVVYDQGYGGYSVQAHIPNDKESLSRLDKENYLYKALETQLSQGNEASELAPPLKILKYACAIAHVDFAKTCLLFLAHWNKCQGWLYPETVSLPMDVERAMRALDWHQLTEQEREGCQLIQLLFDDLDPELRKGCEPLELLEKKHWPLLASLKSLKQGSQEILTTLTQQVFACTQNTPLLNNLTAPLTSEQKMRLLSAYFRVYGLHLCSILPFDELDFPVTQTTIETAIMLKHLRKPPLDKLEENLPAVTFKFQQGPLTEFITLTYDRYGQGLKWPILNGKYLVRFQPEYREIPYRIRLKQARQISYPHSSQPYSYESDLLITDRRTEETIEKTISMNNVHETKEGYRFYLANIVPSDPGQVKKIQLVVNYDPMKYMLTYPGALILTLGIFLLFWLKK